MIINVNEIFHSSFIEIIIFFIYFIIYFINSDSQQIVSKPKSADNGENKED